MSVFAGIFKLGTTITRDVIRTEGKKAATKAAESGRSVVPKYDGYPSWMTRHPSKMTPWEHKQMVKWADVEKRGWFHKVRVTPETQQKWIEDLPHEHGVSAGYVSELVGAAHTKTDLKLIVGYLKSHAADNIGKWERAQLIMQCFDKIKAFDIIKDIF